MDAYGRSRHIRLQRLLLEPPKPSAAVETSSEPVVKKYKPASSSTDDILQFIKFEHRWFELKERFAKVRVASSNTDGIAEKLLKLSTEDF